MDTHHRCLGLHLRVADDFDFRPILPDLFISRDRRNLRLICRVQLLYRLGALVVQAAPRICVWHHGLRFFPRWCHHANHDEQTHSSFRIPVDNPHRYLHDPRSSRHCCMHSAVQATTSTEALQRRELPFRYPRSSFLLNLRGVISVLLGLVYTLQLYHPSSRESRYAQ